MFRFFIYFDTNVIFLLFQQPHAILKKKQIQKLDVPKEQVRRKSSTDIDEQKRCHHHQASLDTTLLYVECQVRSSYHYQYHSLTEEGRGHKHYFSYFTICL